MRKSESKWRHLCHFTFGLIVDDKTKAIAPYGALTSGGKGGGTRGDNSNLPSRAGLGGRPRDFSRWRPPFSAGGAVQGAVSQHGSRAIKV